MADKCPHYGMGKLNKVIEEILNTAEGMGPTRGGGARRLGVITRPTGESKIWLNLVFQMHYRHLTLDWDEGYDKDNNAILEVHAAYPGRSVVSVRHRE